MKTPRFIVFLVAITLQADVGSHCVASEIEQDGHFAIVANLENPRYEPPSPAFRSAALRFPWVYVLAHSSSRSSGTLYIFEIPSEVAGGALDEDDVPKVKPIKMIENVGDGNYIARWNDLIICTRDGGVELFSLDNPREPVRVGQCMPGSKEECLSVTIVREDDRAYVIGDSVLLTYDLSDVAKPRCIGETATDYRGRAGCISGGFLYLGGSRMKDGEEQEGVAVFDLTVPTKPRELAFLPVSRAVYHLFVLPGRQLLASLDGDSLQHSYSPPSRSPSGKAAFFDIANPTQPVLVKELKRSGARAATMFSTSGDSYFVCEAAVFSVRRTDLLWMCSFWDCGETFDGFPYRGDCDAIYAALPNDKGVVVLKHFRKDTESQR